MKSKKHLKPKYRSSTCKNASSIKQQLFYYTQTIIGMIISHFIPTIFFLLWVAISLYLGHRLNKINYKNV